MKNIQFIFICSIIITLLHSCIQFKKNVSLKHFNSFYYEIEKNNINFDTVYFSIGMQLGSNEVDIKSQYSYIKKNELYWDGIATEKKTGKPIPFMGIYCVPNLNKDTVDLKQCIFSYCIGGTNEKGEFKIRLPMTGKEGIIFYQIGFFSSIWIVR